MYWRVRKITPEIILKQYGVHVGLGISLFFNLVLFVTRPSAPKMNAELKVNVENFCKTVTQHLLDTSYISYMDSTAALLSGELSPKVVEALRGNGLIAKTEVDLRAQLRALMDTRQVAAVKITSCNVRDAARPNDPTPVEVKGIVAIHSSQDSGPTEPLPFFFRYYVGARVGQNGQAEMVNGQPVPMIAGFQDMSSGAPAQ